MHEIHGGRYNRAHLAADHDLLYGPDYKPLGVYAAHSARHHGIAGGEVGAVGREIVKLHNRLIAAAVKDTPCHAVIACALDEYGYGGGGIYDARDLAPVIAHLCDPAYKPIRAYHRHIHIDALIRAGIKRQRSEPDTGRFCNDPRRAELVISDARRIIEKLTEPFVLKPHLLKFTSHLFVQRKLSSQPFVLAVGIGGIKKVAEKGLDGIGCLRSRALDRSNYARYAVFEPI